MAKRKTKTTGRPEQSELRIIGGKFRGSKLRYGLFEREGGPVTRPMKHRVREAIFNLVGLEAQGRHAIDLFAGTGALGLEALSRGALSARFIEKHVPTARVIEENIAALGVADCATLLVTSAFLWGKRDLPKGNPQSKMPWLVFCSPPYAFYDERKADMLDLIAGVQQFAPPTSVLVVEADERFDFSLLSQNESTWDLRTYAPAVVGIWRK